MRNPLTLAHWQGDLKGGLVSAIVYLPGSIAWGMLAFSPLGSAFISTGVQAGLYSSIIVGLIAALYGGMPTMQSGARCANALIFSALLIAIVSHASLDLSQASHVDSLLAIAFLAVVLSGLIQIAFGWLKLGQLIKYIPYPVSLGFINATAVLVIINQYGKILDLPQPHSLSELVGTLPQTNLHTVAFAVLTFTIIWYFPKVSKRIPAPVAGLLLATAVYQLLSWLELPNLPGGTLGAISSSIPLPDKLLPLTTRHTAAILVDTLPIVLLASLSMAFMGALESLLTANALESQSNQHADGRRILAGLGIANVIAGCFGAIPGSGSPSRSIPAIKAGARTALATIISSLLFLLVLLHFSTALEYIPEVAMAALIVFVGIQIFDKWTLANLNQIQWRHAWRRNELSNNLLIILTIVLVALLFNLIAAIVTGILIAISIFVFTLSRSVIRDTRFCDQYHSRTVRRPLEREHLQRHGREIAILDLEGPLFFGSAESIKREIELLVLGGARYIILNLKQVRDIDLTAIHILQSIIAEFLATGNELLFSHLDQERRLHQLPVEYEQRHSHQRRRVWISLMEANASNITATSTRFPDVDRALEYCENKLLQSMPRDVQQTIDVFTPEMDLFRGMSMDQIGRIKGLFHKRSYPTGASIMREDERSDFLVLLESGLVDITVSINHSHDKQRIRSLSAGTFLGEMALLDGERRSANVEVIQDVNCYILSVAGFNTIKQTQPEIAYHLLTNISLVFAGGIRALTKMLGE